jgi:hypothetical protein
MALAGSCYRELPSVEQEDIWVCRAPVSTADVAYSLFNLFLHVICDLPILNFPTKNNYSLAVTLCFQQDYILLRQQD